MSYIATLINSAGHEVSFPFQSAATRYADLLAEVKAIKQAQNLKGYQVYEIL